MAEFSFPVCDIPPFGKPKEAEFKSKRGPLIKLHVPTFPSRCKLITIFVLK